MKARAGWKRAKKRQEKEKRKRERQPEGVADAAAAKLFLISSLLGTTSWEIAIQYSDNSVIVVRYVHCGGP